MSSSGRGRFTSDSPVSPQANSRPTNDCHYSAFNGTPKQGGLAFKAQKRANSFCSNALSARELTI